MKNNIDLFDQEYKATTPFDGVYTGLIVGVESSGKKRFRVTGVIKPALPLLLNGNRRKGFRPGDDLFGIHFPTFKVFCLEVQNPFLSDKISSMINYT